MGWTNIDDEFIAREKHRKISLFMGEGWDAGGARVLGSMAFLWGNSQAAGKDRGTIEEIVLWSQLYQALIEDGLGKKWVETLCKPGIDVLESLGDGVYRVIGNQKHIENREKVKKRAEAGGEANKRRIEALKASGELEASNKLELPDSREQSSRQGKAIQGNANKGEGEEPPTADSVLLNLPQTVLAWMAKVKPELWVSWKTTYTNHKWLREEIIKAHAWTLANPQKPRKNIGSFLNGWLSRDKDKMPKVRPVIVGSVHVDTVSGGSLEREEITLTDEERKAMAAEVRERLGLRKEGA